MDKLLNCIFDRFLFCSAGKKKICTCGYQSLQADHQRSSCSKQVNLLIQFGPGNVVACVIVWLCRQEVGDRNMIWTPQCSFAVLSSECMFYQSLKDSVINWSFNA